MEMQNIIVRSLRNSVAFFLRRIADLASQVRSLFQIPPISSQDFDHHFLDISKTAIQLNSRGKSTPLDRIAEIQSKALQAQFRSLGLKPKSLADFASSNGVSQSALWPFLIADREISGVFVEADSEKFAVLGTVYSQFPNCTLIRTRLTPLNVNEVLSVSGLPSNFDFLSVDIDSFDLELLEAILGSGWTPKLISIEINEKIPPPIRFSVNFSCDWLWPGDHFYGCSLAAVLDMASDFGYAPVELVLNNLLLVEKTESQLEASSVAKSLYQKGYLDHPERDTLFSHNRDVDSWLDLPEEELLEAISSFFQVYTGKYKISAERFDSEV